MSETNRSFTTRFPEAVWPNSPAAMLAAWLILCSSFLGLAFAAHAYSRFTGDLAVARAVQAVHGAPVCDLYYGVSWIGYPLASAGIGFAAVALRWLLR